MARASAAGSSRILAARPQPPRGLLYSQPPWGFCKQGNAKEGGGKKGAAPRFDFPAIASP